jgi:hypothetical protein
VRRSMRQRRGGIPIGFGLSGAVNAADAHVRPGSAISPPTNGMNFLEGPRSDAHRPADLSLGSGPMFRSGVAGGFIAALWVTGGWVGTGVWRRSWRGVTLGLPCGQRLRRGTHRCALGDSWGDGRVWAR